MIIQSGDAKLAPAWATMLNNVPHGNMNNVPHGNMKCNMKTVYCVWDQITVFILLLTDAVAHVEVSLMCAFL